MLPTLPLFFPITWFLYENQHIAVMNREFRNWGAMGSWYPKI